MAISITNPFNRAAILTMADCEGRVEVLTVIVVTEINLGHRLTQEKIIVHVDEFVRQSMDSVNVHFDGVRIERWQIFDNLKYVRMRDDLNSFLSGVQPFRYLKRKDLRYGTKSTPIQIIVNVPVQWSRYKCS